MLEIDYIIAVFLDKIKGFLGIFRKSLDSEYPLIL